MFSGTHPILEGKAYHPMVIRFFILQTHYRSTLDFSKEALLASEKGLKRLWEAYENLKKLTRTGEEKATDAEVEKKVKGLLGDFEEFMNDDFGTAKVLANMFEIVPVINAMKDKTIAAEALSADTFILLQTKFKTWLEDIFGFRAVTELDNAKLQGVMQLLIDIRKDAKSKKDFATSDKIRNQLSQLGISLKDEKDGSISYTLE